MRGERLRRLFLCLSLAGCAQLAPPFAVAERCSSGDLTIELQSAGDCPALLAQVQRYRNLYEQRFGRVDLHGYPVRFADSIFVDSEGHTGKTYADAIVLGSHQAPNLPHELNHVRTGSTHDGWCVDYEPWSEEVLDIDERGYLGCKP